MSMIFSKILKINKLSSYPDGTERDEPSALCCTNIGPDKPAHLFQFDQALYFWLGNFSS